MPLRESQSHVPWSCAGVYRDHVNEVSVAVSLTDQLVLMYGPTIDIIIFYNTWENIISKSSTLVLLFISL